MHKWTSSRGTTVAEGVVAGPPGEWFALATATAVSVPLAASNLVLRTAIGMGLSLHAASWVLVLVAAAGMALASLPILTHRPRFRLDATATLLLAAACLAAALTVLCLHRSDADDVIYLPRMVYAVAHPGAPLDGAIHAIAHTPVLTLPLSAAPYHPTAYGFAEAAFAHLGGTGLLGVYYRLAPVLAAVSGTLLVAANLRLLGLSWRAAAVATLVLIPLLLMMGESHRSPGNFTLVRMYQAKCAFIFLGLQLFTTLSLLFFRRPGGARWLLLVVGVVALTGMTTSALVMLPLLSLPLFLAWWLAYGHGDSLRNGIARGAAYAAAMSPALVFALEFRRYAMTRAGFGSRLNAGFPRTFGGQLQLITHGTVLAPSVLLLLGSILVLGLFWRERRHRFLLATAALVGVLYLNPWIAPFLMRYVTSENIYWRLFYLLPLPLLVGAATGLFFERLAGGRLMRHGLPLLVVAVLAMMVVALPVSVLRRDNGVVVALHGYPLDAQADDARACLRLARPGVVLAPIALAQDMSFLSADHPQVVSRADFLANALFAEPREYRRRMSAAAVLTGTGGRLEDLVAVLKGTRPSTVILARDALSTPVAAALRETRLQRKGAVGRWIVYAHTDTAGAGSTPAPAARGMAYDDREQPAG